MCTVQLPPGGNPLAVNKYIISYISFTAVGFAPGGSGRQTCTKQERGSTKGETVPKTTQKHGIHKIKKQKKLRNIS
jgi:hypothetical protein